VYKSVDNVHNSILGSLVTDHFGNKSTHFVDKLVVFVDKIVIEINKAIDFVDK
jgi:hypothetical protein